MADAATTATAAAAAAAAAEDTTTTAATTTAAKSCGACQEPKERLDFSKKQWEKKFRRCKDCVTKELPFQRPTKQGHVNDHDRDNDAENQMEASNQNNTTVPTTKVSTRTSTSTGSVNEPAAIESNSSTAGTSTERSIAMAKYTDEFYDAVEETLPGTLTPTTTNAATNVVVAKDTQQQDQDEPQSTTTELTKSNETTDTNNTANQDEPLIASISVLAEETETTTATAAATGSSEAMLVENGHSPHIETDAAGTNEPSANSNDTATPYRYVSFASLHQSPSLEQQPSEPEETKQSTTHGNAKDEAHQKANHHQVDNDNDDDDIAHLARNWEPSAQETQPLIAPPPVSLESQLEPVEPVSLSEDEEDDGSDVRFRRTLSLLAAPLVDESGSARSVVAGLCSLFLVGATIGLVSRKNATLPTPWYRWVSAMIGYIYFLCWSVSFYPQVLSNYKRRSTHGLSPDFCALNVLGFACYTAYTVSLYWSSAMQELYRERYGSEVTVQSNDVAFAIHALILSSITLVQIGYYGGVQQRPSKVIVATIVAILGLCAIYPCLVVAKSNSLNWLDYLYLLSFVKIGISLIKYIPQVILNCERKSTVGWSIWNILLDFTGGALSILQLVLDCADLGDFSGITGNLAKFGLGFVSIVFDMLFMTQHYVLYPEAGGDDSAETEPLLSEEERQGIV
jgi:cystinosin